MGATRQHQAATAVDPVRGARAGGAAAERSVAADARLGSLRRAIAVSRPLFWMNSASLCVVAAILARSEPGWLAAALAVFATFPLNLFVHAVNDLHDRDTDARNPRKGSVEGARATEAELRRLVALSVALVAPFAALFADAGSAASTAALALLLAVSWAYSAPPLRLKGRPGWDSVANAAYVLPFVVAALLLGVDPVPWTGVAAFALWAIASHALTSIQDEEVDRASGLETVATSLGRRRTALLALGIDVVVAALVAATHPVVTLLPIAHAAIAAWVAFSSDESAPRVAYRAFIGLNFAAGFVLVTWIALAHPGRTLWAAIAMLSLCAAVASALAFSRGAGGEA